MLPVRRAHHSWGSPGQKTAETVIGSSPHSSDLFNGEGLDGWSWKLNLCESLHGSFNDFI